MVHYPCQQLKTSICCQVSKDLLEVGRTEDAVLPRASIQKLGRSGLRVLQEQEAVCEITRVFPNHSCWNRSQMNTFRLRPMIFCSLLAGLAKHLELMRTEDIRRAIFHHSICLYVDEIFIAQLSLERHEVVTNPFSKQLRYVCWLD